MTAKALPGLRSRTSAPLPGPAGGQVADVFRPVRVEPAYKAVSAEIERNILNGALQPGMPLPTEQELSERFGVHRSTVREAIRQVEQEGLLQRREGRRLFVSLPGLGDLSPRATRMLLLQQVTFQELWDVALALEPMAARLAAQHAEPAELALLEDNMTATAALTDNLPVAGRPPLAPAAQHAALAELDVAFHALVGQASHNRALMLAREPVSLLFNPTLFQIHQRLPQSMARNLEAHRRILDALQRRDAEDAARWALKHMVDFQRGFAMAGLDMGTPITLPAQGSQPPGDRHES